MGRRKATRGGTACRLVSLEAARACLAERLAKATYYRRGERAKEPTEAELEQMIAEQRATLPRWWQSEDGK